MITPEEAVERAKQELTESLTSFQGREVNVSFRPASYTVVFPPPEDTLGGDFTVVVDAESGEILDVTIER